MHGLNSSVDMSSLSSPTGLFLKRKGKEMFYLTTHSTHFVYGYMTHRTTSERSYHGATSRSTTHKKGTENTNFAKHHVCIHTIVWSNSVKEY